MRAGTEKQVAGDPRATGMRDWLPSRLTYEVNNHKMQQEAGEAPGSDEDVDRRHPLSTILDGIRNL